MSKLELYAHPFSSYCWKVLIALWENNATLQRLSPVGKLPLLLDDGEILVVVEADASVQFGEDLGSAAPRGADEEDPVESLLVDRVALGDGRRCLGVVVAQRLLLRAREGLRCTLADGLVADARVIGERLLDFIAGQRIRGGTTGLEQVVD